MVLTSEQTAIAINWWAKVICNPKYDNGCGSASGGLATIMAHLAKQEVLPEQVEVFKKELLNVLMTNDETIRYGIHCDYHPCTLLANVMDIAKIPQHQAPWKTHMWFEDDKVFVRYGYKAKEKELIGL